MSTRHPRVRAGPEFKARLTPKPVFSFHHLLLGPQGLGPPGAGPDAHLLPGGRGQAPSPRQEGEEPASTSPPPQGKPGSGTTKEQPRSPKGLYKEHPERSRTENSGQDEAHSLTRLLPAFVLPRLSAFSPP